MNRKHKFLYTMAAIEQPDATGENRVNTHEGLIPFHMHEFLLLSPLEMRYY